MLIIGSDQTCLVKNLNSAIQKTLKTFRQLNWHVIHGRRCLFLKNLFFFSIRNAAVVTKVDV
jgi:hypothetical protein